MPEDLTPQENARLLHLLQDDSNNIRHAKGQQWQAGYYTLLAYGGLVAAALALKEHTHSLGGFAPYAFAVLAIVVGCLGVWIVWNLQCWMQRLRISMSRAEGKLSVEYREISGGNDEGENYKSVFYKSLQAWVISVVITLGSLVAFFVICTTPLGVEVCRSWKRCDPGWCCPYTRQICNCRVVLDCHREPV